jgi:hypothetical protein
MRLLGQVGTCALDYHARITPTTLFIEAAHVFDDMVNTARREILQRFDHTDPGSPPPIESRSITIAQLPFRYGGLGHTSVAALAPAAFLSSVRSTQHDPKLSEHELQHALRVYTEPAYDLLTKSLHAPITSFPSVIRLLPATAAALANAPASPSTRLTKTTAKKIQSAIMSVANVTSRNTLRRDCHPSQIGENDLSAPASCHLHLITSRSQQSRMMVGSLWFDSNVIESAAFVAYTRYYLGLLPLLRPWCQTVPRFPSPGTMNICGGDHPSDEILHPDGAHCISCSACFALRHAAHERINKVFADFAREAGATVTYNPSTDAMMAGHYGEFARILFPKISSAARRKVTADLIAAFRLAASSPDPAQRELGSQRAAAIIAACPPKLEGLRVDSIIQLQHQLLWLDIGVVHSTAKSILLKVITFLTQLHKAELSAGGALALNTLSQSPSPAVLAYTRVKSIKYSGLIEDCARQVKSGKRSSVPVLIPCIFSHSGEMSPESIRVVELITREYATMVSGHYFEDGLALKRRTALFRTRFKDALMVANANGFGSTLAHAGTPRAGRTLSPPDAFGGLPDWEISVAY